MGRRPSSRSTVELTCQSCGRIDAVIEGECDVGDVNRNVERSNRRGVEGERDRKLFVLYLGEKHLTRFIVVAGDYELLSGKDARRLGILNFDRNI